MRLRVVADHVRSSLMLIGDGVTPGNEGRGYVLRRMLRRSVRSMRLLGYEDPCLPELLPISLERMKQSYPELEAGFDRIAQIAYAEEEAFRRTLAAGTTILDTGERGPAGARDDRGCRRGQGAPTLSASSAFQLHDTYGFPIDLTLEMAAEQGLEVDREGFAHLMREQRQRAKADAKSKKSGHANTEVWRDLRANGATEFLAYQELTSEATVIGLVVDGVAVSEMEPGQRGQVVLNRTPFYAESGGQVADEGVITADGVAAARGRRAAPGQGPDRAHRRGRQRPAAHRRERAGRRSTPSGGSPRARRTPARTSSTRRCGRCSARRRCSPARTTSPATCGSTSPGARALSAATRSEIEEVANLAVRKDLPVSATFMPLPRAREIGALALFGETYDEDVRVVEIGGPWSRELCGGTHVQHSSQIGALTITGESSVGSGVRRVEAFVGIDALRYLAKERAIVAELTGLVGARPDELAERVGAMVTRLKDAERELERARREQVQAAAGNLTERARDVNGVTYLGHDAGEAGADDVRTMVLDLRGRLGAERPTRRRDHRCGQGPPGRRGGDQRGGARARHPGR